MDHATRRAALAPRLETLELDSVLVTRMTNIRYLTGFTGSAGTLLVRRDPLLIVDFRYALQVSEQVSDIDVRVVFNSREIWPETMRELARDGSGKIGFEAEALTAAQYLALTAENRYEWVPTRGLVEALRAIKDDAELEAIRTAMQLTDETFARILDVLKPGLTELRIAGEIELLQRSLGSERSPYDIIVASGPRTALPHGMASARVIGDREPVMFDFGGVVRGYASDLTRTVHIGSPSPEFRRLYDIVLEAQNLAKAAMRPGITSRAVDAIGRDHIAGHGYGEAFGHSLGHSIGLDVHETPVLSPHDDMTLESGMVLAIEPAIYVPEIGGVRIEDLVVITENGASTLTTSDRSLIEL
jgi:Xaa-Pro aminopeptidase